jgi:pyruvate/2-oxoglutarate dehydrogenase complex dihydrolipoamide dehydrogenase (E3) component
MSASDEYQAVVIGSGQGGKPLCVALAGAGWRTAIIEREHVGGTCVNVGCTPTKTMVASGRVAYLTRRAADYGVQTGNIRIDMTRIRQRKRDIVESFRSRGQATLEKSNNLDLIFGEASFTGPKSLLVRLKNGTRRTLHAEHVFIDAGCRPAVPKLDGLSDVPYLSSTSIMELDNVPEHLLVLGGGYVGLEFGQMFRRLGSRVSIVHRGDRLLRDEDSDVADEIAALLRQDGIDIFLNTTAESVARAGSQILLTARDETGKIRELQGSHLLVATGRVPNVEALHLNAAGIATSDHGFIKVNSNLETSTPGVYALGDINGGPAFTHISYDDFRILRTNLIDKGSVTTEGRPLPYTIYIDPQLGRIGITEAQARAQNKNIRIAKMPMSSVARALEVDESRGFMKAVVDAETNQVLGAAVLGIEGGEVMSMLQLAMMGKIPFTILRDAIFAHPTLAESLNNLFTHFAS